MKIIIYFLYKINIFHYHIIKEKNMVKRGLLIGINYRNTADQLYGCINDVNNVKNFLDTQLGYTQHIILTDDTPIKPTKANIVNAMNAFVQSLRSGDEGWFHYSGHGVLVRDSNRDEESGYDSCIAPLDYARSGVISDDFIRSNLVSRVPRGVKLYVVLDACHSGTGCDLRYKWDDSSFVTDKTKAARITLSPYVVSDWTLRQTVYEFKKYSKTTGEVYCISGCQDNQQSGDIFVESQKEYGGVLTSTMLSLLKSNDLKTYKWKNLLKDVCCSEKVNGHNQKTALTSGNPLNMESSVFSFPKTPAPTLPTAASNIKKNQKKNLKKRYLTSNIMQMMHKNKNVMKKMLFA